MRSSVAPLIVAPLIVALLAVAVASPIVASAQPAKKKKRKLPPDYRVKLVNVVKAELNKPATVSLTIAPQPRYVISRIGPLYISLAVKPATGLTFKRMRFRRKQAADARADSPRFDLRMKGAMAGKYQVAVSIRFWVCAKRSCRPVKDSRILAVEVVGPPAPASQPATQPAVNANP